jgi:hypothetical protein
MFIEDEPLIICPAGSLYNQYSFNQPVIYPGLQLTFDTSVGNGTYHVDSPGNSGTQATRLSASVEAAEAKKKKASGLKRSMKRRLANEVPGEVMPD